MDHQDNDQLLRDHIKEFLSKLQLYDSVNMNIVLHFCNTNVYFYL